MTTIDALKRELRGYELQGKTDRAAQVRKVLADLGVKFDEPRQSAVETAADRKPRETRRRKES